MKRSCKETKKWEEGGSSQYAHSFLPLTPSSLPSPILSLTLNLFSLISLAHLSLPSYLPAALSHSPAIPPPPRLSIVSRGPPPCLSSTAA